MCAEDEIAISQPGGRYVHFSQVRNRLQIKKLIWPIPREKSKKPLFYTVYPQFSDNIEKNA